MRVIEIQKEFEKLLPSYVSLSKEDELGEALKLRKKIEEEVLGLRKGSFHLSQTGGCKRLRIFSYFGIPTLEYDTETLGTFLMGLLVEQGVVQLYQTLYENIETGYVIRDESLNVVGNADIYIPSEDKIIEVKSTKESAAKFLPNLRHLIQLVSYLVVGNKSKGVLLYVFKENFKRVSFEVNLTDFMRRYFKNLIVKELEILNKYVKKKTLPKIPDYYSPKEYPCLWKAKEYTNFCPYYHKCWKEEFEYYFLKRKLGKKKISSVSVDLKELGKKLKEIDKERNKLLDKLQELNQLRRSVIDSIVSRVNPPVSFEVNEDELLEIEEEVKFETDVKVLLDFGLLKEEDIFRFGIGKKHYAVNFRLKEGGEYVARKNTLAEGGSS